MVINTANQTAGTLRIGGLATGLDTTSIVNDLMRVEEMKVDRFRQQRQLVEWRKEEYRAITGRLKEFSDGFFNILNPATNMRSASTYRAIRATSSNPAFVSVTANNDAMEGRISIAGIDSLATPSSILGNRSLPAGQTLDSSLETLGFAASGSNINFEINGRTYSFASTVNMRHVLNTVNSDLTAGVRFSYSGIESRFILQTQNTGAATTLTTSGVFLENLGLAGTTERRINGTDASVRFGATAGTETVTLTRPTNTFTIDGVTYSLMQATPAGTSVNITVDRNVDKAFDAIKSFIEKYNEVIDKVSGKLSEQRFRDYPPLTNAQREEMEETEITLWEQRAKSGLLNNSSMLRGMLGEMRLAFSELVSAAGTSLSAIGITTGPHQEMGKLRLDESRLRSALQTDGDQIARLLANGSSIEYSPNLTLEQRQTRRRESGIAHRLSDILQDYVRNTRDTAGRRGTLLERAGFEGTATQFNNALSSELERIDLRIDRALEVMERTEQRHWRQFTALEQAIQRMNAQSMWLMQQLQGGS